MSYADKIKMFHVLINVQGGFQKMFVVRGIREKSIKHCVKFWEDVCRIRKEYGELGIPSYFNFNEEGVDDEN